MKSKTRDLIIISMFAAFTAIGAFIRIPIPIVPFTLQYFFCALGAIILGAKKGALAQILYVVIGLIGVPIFTQGGGPQYIFKPTFGYLIGFIFGAFIIGKITEKSKNLNIFKVFISCILGLLAIYLFGIIHMIIIYNFYLRETMSIWTAISVGAITFIPSDFLLSLVTSIISIKVLPQLKRLGYIN